MPPDVNALLKAAKPGDTVTPPGRHVPRPSRCRDGVSLRGAGLRPDHPRRRRRRRRRPRPRREGRRHRRPRRFEPRATAAIDAAGAATDVAVRRVVDPRRGARRPLRERHRRPDRERRHRRQHDRHVARTRPPTPPSPTAPCVDNSAVGLSVIDARTRGGLQQPDARRRHGHRAGRSRARAGGRSQRIPGLLRRQGRRADRPPVAGAVARCQRRPRRPLGAAAGHLRRSRRATISARSRGSTGRPALDRRRMGRAPNLAGFAAPAKDIDGARPRSAPSTWARTRCPPLHRRRARRHVHRLR